MGWGVRGGLSNPGPFLVVSISIVMLAPDVQPALGRGGESTLELNLAQFLIASGAEATGRGHAPLHTHLPRSCKFVDRRRQYRQIFRCRSAKTGVVCPAGWLPRVFMLQERINVRVFSYLRWSVSPLHGQLHFFLSSRLQDSGCNSPLRPNSGGHGTGSCRRLPCMWLRAFVCVRLCEVRSFFGNESFFYARSPISSHRTLAPLFVVRVVWCLVWNILALVFFLGWAMYAKETNDDVPKTAAIAPLIAWEGVQCVTFPSPLSRIPCQRTHTRCHCRCLMLLLLWLATPHQGQSTHQCLTK